jgi:NAD(P)-dependent dehydrogenase (short-subunit alcohol dehydrogenase family)
MAATSREVAWLAAAACAAAVGFSRGRSRRRAPSRVVLVTGGSRGLGLRLAHEYLVRGTRVAICARDSAELERAVVLLGGGARLLAVPCDVVEESEVGGLVAAVQERFGGIDTVVNNAGVIQVGPAEHMGPADYAAAWRTHLLGPLLVARAVLPGMRERGCGRIVNIASIAGLLPVPHMLPYTSSKFALAGWSDALRAELAGSGISVTTVCPALLRTGSPRHARFKGRHREEYAWFSIGDSLPLLSMDAGRAAHRIVEAAERGRARVVLPAAARLPVALHGIWPELVLRAFALADRLLPDPGGVGSASRTGSESTSSWSPSWLTQLGERAAAENNQLPAPVARAARHAG